MNNSGDVIRGRMEDIVVDLLLIEKRGLLYCEPRKVGVRASKWVRIEKQRLCLVIVLRPGSSCFNCAVRCKEEFEEHSMKRGMMRQVEVVHLRSLRWSKSRTVYHVCPLAKMSRSSTHYHL